MKWNLRWAAAKRDIWRPSDLLKAFEEAGFTPSLSKVAALWSGKPISVRLDDLDKMCAALVLRRATGPDPSERASMSPSWIKSSLSFANGNCVEVADLPDGTVGIRHSRDSDGRALRFTPDEWGCVPRGRPARGVRQARQARG